MDDLAQRESSRRLLEAASEAFARHGYAGARIRQIVDAAQVNLAAVNYYFGGKEGLYKATLRFLATRSSAPLAERSDLTPERRLRRHVYALLERFVGVDNPSTLGRILVHEAMHPTAGAESALAETLVVELDRVRKLLAACAPEAAEADVHHAALGLLGQCVLYLYAREPAGQGRDYCKALARRITDFSLGGLQRLRSPVVSE